MMVVKSPRGKLSKSQSKGRGLHKPRVAAGKRITSEQNSPLRHREIDGAGRTSAVDRLIGPGTNVAGLAVRLQIAVRMGQQSDRVRVDLAGMAHRRPGVRRELFPGVRECQTVAGQITRGTRQDRLVVLLAALAHGQRLRILLKLLGGEATHRLLAKATGLKAGPLYHHLRELRAAGLIGPRVRDLYVLTRSGRRVILAALALERLCR